MNFGSYFLEGIIIYCERKKYRTIKLQWNKISCGWFKKCW